jgi:hypothetical protein
MGAAYSVIELQAVCKQAESSFKLKVSPFVEPHRGQKVRGHTAKMITMVQIIVRGTRAF